MVRAKRTGCCLENWDHTLDQCRVCSATGHDIIRRNYMREPNCYPSEKHRFACGAALWRHDDSAWLTMFSAARKLSADESGWHNGDESCGRILHLLGTRWNPAPHDWPGLEWTREKAPEYVCLRGAKWTRPVDGLPNAALYTADGGWWPTSSTAESPPNTWSPNYTCIDREADVWRRADAVEREKASEPDSLGLYHDRVHKDVGRSRVARTVRSKAANVPPPPDGMARAYLAYSGNVYTWDGSCYTSGDGFDVPAVTVKSFASWQPCAPLTTVRGMDYNESGDARPSPTFHTPVPPEDVDPDDPPMVLVADAAAILRLPGESDFICKYKGPPWWSWASELYWSKSPGDVIYLRAGDDGPFIRVWKHGEPWPEQRPNVLALTRDWSRVSVHKHTVLGDSVSVVHIATEPKAVNVPPHGLAYVYVSKNGNVYRWDGERYTCDNPEVTMAIVPRAMLDSITGSNLVGFEPYVEPDAAPPKPYQPTGVLLPAGEPERESRYNEGWKHGVIEHESRSSRAWMERHGCHKCERRNGKLFRRCDDCKEAFGHVSTDDIVTRSKWPKEVPSCAWEVRRVGHGWLTSDDSGAVDPAFAGCGSPKSLDVYEWRTAGTKARLSSSWHRLEVER